MKILLTVSDKLVLFLSVAAGVTYTYVYRPDMAPIIVPLLLHMLAQYQHAPKS